MKAWCSTALSQTSHNSECFVDIGIKENGLVHISELSDHYVSTPSDVVALHQQLRVRIKAIDTERRRIALTLKNVDQQ